MTIQPIDLLHLGRERVIGVYVVETPEGRALFDCGPATCFERLRDAVDLTTIDHLLLSHIHLDHAGAVGHVVRANPGIRVHVSEVGAPHVLDPSRLVASARRLYGDELDRLYGEPLPVPQENLDVIWEVAAGLKTFPAPGHASHHVCYLLDDGTLLAGDATGVRIMPGDHVLPHAPPPDLDLEAWGRTFDEILRHQPERLALIHFGVVAGIEDVAEHVHRARSRLDLWSERVSGGVDADAFVAAAQADIEAEEGRNASEYLRAAPLVQSFLGLERYHRKKRERDAASAASA